MIFAHLVQYFSSIPSTGRFRLFGLTLTEKFFTYVMGAQLVLTGGAGAGLSALSGLLAGLLYRADALPLKHMVMPPPVAGACKRFVSPLLESPPALLHPHTRARALYAPQQQQQQQQQQQPHQQQQQQQQQQAAFANPLLPPIAFPPPAGAAQAAPSEENINALIAMGFSREVAISVLLACGNDLNLALNSLLEN